MTYSKIFKNTPRSSLLIANEPKRAKYRIKNEAGEYEVIYLETSADQVIESTEQQFVSATQKTDIADTKVKAETNSAAIMTEQERAMAAEQMLLNRLNALDGSGSGSIAGILDEAKAYTDTEVDKAKVALGSFINTVGTQVDANMQALATVDSRIATSKEETLTYVDGELSAIDTDIANLDAAYKAADSVNLNTSKTYTDSQVGSVKMEMEGYTDQKLADLVGSAPEALDTLQELAAALQGNQASITDILTQIGTKADKTTVATELSLKANIEYVDNQLDTKANQTDLVAVGQAVSNTNSALQKEITDRTNAVNTVSNNLVLVGDKVSELEDRTKDFVPLLSAIQPEGYGIGHVWLEYK